MQTLMIQGVTVSYTDTVTGELKTAILPDITLNRYGCDKVDNGISIVLYDNYTNRILDNLGFDAEREYCKVR